MRKISEKALYLRAKRKAEKDGLILKKHNSTYKDHLMGGKLYAMWVRPENNAIESYVDFDGFVDVCRKEGILRHDEEVEENS
jgi:hypothetical protein